MNITQSIEYIYPTLTEEDYMVQDNSDGKGPILTWLSKTITQPTQAELETAWVEVVKLQKTSQALQEFDDKLIEYNKGYSKKDIANFTDKFIKAKEVLAGGVNNYITKMSTSLGITPLQFATVIKQKADAYEDFVIQAEIDRDTLINNL